MKKNFKSCHLFIFIPGSGVISLKNKTCFCLCKSAKLIFIKKLNKLFVQMTGIFEIQKFQKVAKLIKLQQINETLDLRFAASFQLTFQPNI